MIWPLKLAAELPSVAIAALRHQCGSNPAPMICKNQNCNQICTLGNRNLGW
jgi:hypothetical protein